MKVLYCAIYRGFWHTHRELIQREKEGRKEGEGEENLSLSAMIRKTLQDHAIFCKKGRKMQAALFVYTGRNTSN